MSSPATLPLGAFLESLIRFLMPFFLGTAVDMPAARAEILDTLASYGVRTRAEWLNAAQVIAFSMTALDVLSEAKSTELTPNQKIRYRGCANGLSRATLQQEKTLERRLANDPPAPADAAQEPIDDTPAPEVQATLAQAQTRMDGARLHPTIAARPTASAERHAQLWAVAMKDALGQIGATPAG